MKNTIKTLCLVATIALSGISQATIYYVNGQGQDIGNITVINGIPTTASGHPFYAYNFLNGQAMDNVIIVQDATVGEVNLPVWDMFTVGNITANGDINVRNLTFGIEGQLTI